MSLSARAIAVGGIGFSVLLLATDGLLDIPEPVSIVAEGGGSSKKIQKRLHNDQMILIITLLAQEGLI